RLSTSLLDDALFAEATDGLQSGAAIGQFLPGGAGGPNATTGYDSKSLINPWDFVLMLEGALLFAATASKRLEQTAGGVLSYPFTVRPSGLGYGTAAPNEDGSDSRGEIWMPMWGQPARLATLESLLGEGRARVGRRAPRNGVDFAQAVATLGVDRGVDAFTRYGFHVRNGLSYLATPLGRFKVNLEPSVDLLRELDTWLDRVRGKANSDRAPNSVTRAMRVVDEAIVELCRHHGDRRVLDLFLALGDLVDQLGRSVRWSRDSFVRPPPPLTRDWMPHLPADMPELRLAMAAASLFVPHSGLIPPYPVHVNIWPVTAGRG